MDEAELIAISRRFRILEDSIEDPRLLLRERDDGRYQTARSERDMALEVCRDDMVAMQEEIRKRAKP